jgi:hypothetical protein
MHQKCVVSNRGSIAVKWQELDFTLLLNLVLELVTLAWQIAECIKRIATRQMVILLVATVR